MIKKSKRLLIYGIVFLCLVGMAVAYMRNNALPFIIFNTIQFYFAGDPAEGVGYVPVNDDDFTVSILASGFNAPTRVVLAPDSAHLLVTQLTGEVLALSRDNGVWNNTPRLVGKIETSVPGFPPEELGLVGMVFASDYEDTGNVFFLYTYKNSDGGVENRVSIVSLKERFGSLVFATEPQKIFTANVPGNFSHQITDGIGVEVEGKSHLLFLIGEGFDATRAQDLALEGGKVMLIQVDGSNPLGMRPYPKHPKIQAVGIRNAYTMAQNQYDTRKRVLIGDTGPDTNDRIMYAPLFLENRISGTPLNLSWDGSVDSLKRAIRDPFETAIKDIVLTRLPKTETFVGLSVHPGGGVIPPSTAKEQSVLALVFGKTGSKKNSPGKALWLGQLKQVSHQPKITFTPIIIRSPEVEGSIGNPIGLTVDSQTGDIFFADILEGRVYVVSPK
ncbi:MAG: hypothetical protein HON29_04040 [Candidatus Magasanikbacteria bacterium]|nr:hypothetical protein [Candidatus Magasanikbacteria bacterium]MBT5820211.1 hypothetical protein [Candidatus Magasanikbacteria bacterium]